MTSILYNLILRYRQQRYRVHDDDSVEETQVALSAATDAEYSPPTESFTPKKRPTDGLVQSRGLGRRHDGVCI